jgi:hypothetical protein
MKNHVVALGVDAPSKQFVLGLNWLMLGAWIYLVRPGAWVELDHAWGLDLSGQTWSSG